VTTETGDQPAASFTDPVDILLVDDDQAWARATARLLEHNVEAFRVELATSLDGGHEQYARTDFDCVVCDYQLGDGTGLALLETVREYEPALPFILVTGRGDEQVASEATRKGITEYIVKEHDDDEAELLTARVGKAVESARLERALERERHSKHTILELLTATSNELELCREFCTLLVENHDYACAWIGTERNEGEVVIEASAGSDAFLETVVRGVTGTNSESADPVLAALKADEPVVRSLSDLPTDGADGTSWRTIASEHGFETTAGLPIKHKGVRFGVLGVYATEQPTIDEQRLDLLAEFTDTLGYALQSAEFKRSMLSDRPVSVGIELEDSSIPLVALNQDLSRESRLTVPSVVHRSEDETLCVACIEGASEPAIHSTVAAADRVAFANDNEARRDSDGDGQFECGLVVTGETPESVLAGLGASVSRTVIRNGVCRVSVQVPDHTLISTLEKRLGSTYSSATVSAIRQGRRSDSPEGVSDPLRSLTEKQENALQHAYYQGFFEHPRGMTATELADQLGVTRQTVTHHLRAAERKVLDQVLDE